MKKLRLHKFFVIVFVFVIIIIYAVYYNSKQREAKIEFKKKFESYSVIKDFLIEELQNSEREGIHIGYNGKWYYYYYNQDGRIDRESYEILDDNVENSLNVLREVKDTSFDFCRAELFNEYKIIRFMYDWECAYDKEYSIYYCENVNVLKSFLETPVPTTEHYDLKKFKDNWYYVGW